MNCVRLFPFHAISVEEFSSIFSGADANKRLLGNNIGKFSLFCSYEYKFGDFENYVDPDNNFYNDIYVNCGYYYDNEFKKNIKQVKTFLSYILIVEFYFTIFIK